MKKEKKTVLSTFLGFSKTKKLCVQKTEQKISYFDLKITYTFLFQKWFLVVNLKNPCTLKGTVLPEK